MIRAAASCIIDRDSVQRIQTTLPGLRAWTGAGSTITSRRSKGIVHEVLSCYVKAIETGSAPIKYDVQSWQDLKVRFFAQLEIQRSFGMTRSCPFGTIATGVTEMTNASGEISA